MPILGTEVPFKGNEDAPSDLHQVPAPDQIAMDATSYTSYDVPSTLTRVTADVTYLRNAFGEIVRADSEDTPDTPE